MPRTGCVRSPAATKERLLDAAERLFAERGFGGTSMRALAETAQTSVSAANYHFGSKQALVSAALIRRLAPLNQRRLLELESLERAAAPAPPTLEEVIESFLRPSFEAWRESEELGNGRYRHVLAQLHSDPHETIAALKVELFRPLVERYVDALARTLPGQSREELLLGLQLVVGLLVHVVGGHLSLPVPSDGAASCYDEMLLQRMVAFAAAGLRSKRLTPSGGLARGRDR